MKLDRRDLLRSAGAAGAGALLAGCNRMIGKYTAPAIPDSIGLPTGDIDPIVRLVNRVSFGPTPNEIERVLRLGAEKYVEEQLEADGIDTPQLKIRLRNNPALRSRPFDQRDMKPGQVLLYLQQAAILRATYSPHQLLERMVDFWSNHFNVFGRKIVGQTSLGVTAHYTGADQRRVIRKHALGKFPEMVRASAHSPAMLSYLDNQVNQRDGEGKKRTNENYARELMELHTLGVDGGYTQKDVMEVARCFTGWGVDNGFGRPRGQFRYYNELHDDGPKTVLGVPIPAGGGQADGDRVLGILSTHPSTARFISRKLCRYFLGDESEEWTRKLSEIYLKTGGDVKSMLKPLLLSSELRNGQPLVKRPFDFMVSAARATLADTNGFSGIQSYLSKMGQPLYQWPMPDGYPDETQAWTGSLLARWNFAYAFTTGKIKGTFVEVPKLVEAAGGTTGDSATATALVETILAQDASSDSGKRVAATIEGFLSRAPRNSKRPILEEAAALVMASPEFQWR
jgi:uncharacterized protein (DUF1800 family)